MDLDVVFLGTGGSVPSARRNTAAVLVRRGGDRILFDCGEGTQRQMQRSIGLIPVADIFLTHLHADHYLGLPGLLKSYEMNDRVEPLKIHGPPGLIDLMEALRRVIGRPAYPIELVELNGGETAVRDGYAIEPFEVEHRVLANGYALVEDSRPGRFDPERARALGVDEGPDFGALQRGERVRGANGEVAPEQVMDAQRPGRKVVVTGDTEPCESTRHQPQQQDTALRSDLLFHT